MSEATTTAAAPAAAPTTTTTQAAPAATTTTQAATTDWTSGFNDDLKGFVQNKGFKDPASVLDSYRNLEKLMGTPKERLLRLPENMDDATAMGEIYTRLGRPQTPEDYKIEVPKDGDASFAKWAQGTFHELGLTTKQASALVNKWNEFAVNHQNGMTEKSAAEMQAQHDGLKREWGAAFDQNISVAKRAAAEFGISAEVIDKMESAMGFTQVMKLMHTIGAKLGEGEFVTNGSRGGSFNGALTPDQARNKINSLRQDNEFIKRYTNGDASAKAEMERLHAMAYPS